MPLLWAALLTTVGELEVEGSVGERSAAAAATIATTTAAADAVRDYGVTYADV
jgi:hypothetical protein